MFTFQRVYIKSGRQLKRIESVKRSPVFASYSETLSGLSSIRAYRQQARFTEKADWLLDNSTKTYFLVFTSNRYGFSLQWRHNGCDSVSNRQPHDSLLNRLFRHRSKKTPLALVRGIHRGPVNSPYKWSFTRKMFPFDDVIMFCLFLFSLYYSTLLGQMAVISQVIFSGAF